jgi:hypothetical protein
MCKPLAYILAGIWIAIIFGNPWNPRKAQLN